MEKTLNIPHSNHNVKYSKPPKIQYEFLSMLTDNISFNKIRPGENPTEMLRVLNELEAKGIISGEYKNQAFSILQCGQCKLVKSKCFECQCRICEHVVNEFKSNIMAEMQNKLLSSYLEVVDKICCPECGQKISKDDLDDLNPEHDNYVKECRINETIANAEKNGNFTCFTCKRTRGSNLLPSKQIHPCLHMCKFCISKSYYKNKSKKCLECKIDIGHSELIKEKFSCSKCNVDKYFIGDLMIEIYPGCILCNKCGIDALDKGFSPITRRLIDQRVKEENYLYLYRECAACGTEDLLRNCAFMQCCFKYFCKPCKSNSAKCPSCG